MCPSIPLAVSTHINHTFRYTAKRAIIQHPDMRIKSHIVDFLSRARQTPKGSRHTTNTFLTVTDGCRELKPIDKLIDKNSFFYFNIL